MTSSFTQAFFQPTRPLVGDQLLVGCSSYITTIIITILQQRWSFITELRELKYKLLQCFIVGLSNKWSTNHFRHLLEIFFFSSSVISPH